MMLKRMSALLLAVLMLSLWGSAQAGWVTLMVSDQNTDETQASSYADTLFPDPVVNLDVQSSGDFQYVVLDDGTAQITKYTGSDAQLVLPRTLDGYMVTSIGDKAFYDCNLLTSVVLPEGLVSIGNMAFFSCENLSNIQFPASLTSISNDAFLYTAYEHVTAPAGMANTQQEASAELCSYCVGGWVECSTCGTFGCCPSCDGLGGPMVHTANGWERDECNACGDSGACPTCGYSGFLECKFCNGTGFAY